jgi:hypothetical protein
VSEDISKERDDTGPRSTIMFKNPVLKLLARFHKKWLS